MNKVYCYCHFVGVYQCARTRMCVSGGCRGREGPGGVEGDVSLCARARARARVCVCVCVYMVAILKVSRLGVCVCVHGRYLEGHTVGCVCVYMVAILKVSRLGVCVCTWSLSWRSHGWRRERESQVCVYSHVARYKGVANSWSVLVNEETIISSLCYCQQVRII